MSELAFLGTGMIGGGMVENLLGLGHRVRVWNRSADKARALVEKGAVLAATPAEAVRGLTRVHVVLSDDAAVDGVLAQVSFEPGTALLDHTTTAPVPTAARAAKLDAVGVEFVHAPVFMSPQMCRDRQGIILAAGPQARFDVVQPWLAEMTGKVAYLGERSDRAAAFKLFGNAMILTLGGGLADLFTLGKAVGIEPTDVLSLFDLFNPASTLAVRGARMARGEYAPTSFALEMARKDVRLMQETAAGAPLAVLNGLAERMDQLIAAGHGELDVGVLALDALKR
jgi:3-hydroxyisobutyrate dehydrogenase